MFDRNKLPKKSKIIKKFLAISHNGFGISEVAEGIANPPAGGGAIPRGNFAYSELCEVASASERQSITRKNSEAIMPKRSERPDRSEA